MKTPKHNLANSQLAFIDALAKYQAATLKSCLAVKRLTAHTQNYCHALCAVVEKTGVLAGAAR